MNDLSDKGKKKAACLNQPGQQEKEKKKEGFPQRIASKEKA